MPFPALDGRARCFATALRKVPSADCEGVWIAGPGVAGSGVGAHDTEDRCRILQSLVTQGNLTTAALEAAALGSTIEALTADGQRILTAHDLLRPGGG